MSWKVPQRVTGRVLSEFKHATSKLPVTTEFSGELLYPDGVSSSFYCSFITGDEQWVNVSGARGYLRVPDFVLPFTGNQIAFQTGNPVFDVQGCDFEMQPHCRRWAVKERSHSHPTAQESQLFRHFAEQVKSGTLNPLWPEVALKTQQVMQACRESSLSQGRPVEVDPKL
jgi:predicted dehydrogenase